MLQNIMNCMQYITYNTWYMTYCYSMYQYAHTILLICIKLQMNHSRTETCWINMELHLDGSVTEAIFLHFPPTCSLLRCFT